MYVNGEPLINSWLRTADIPASTALSRRIAKDLKSAGFRFCGPTTVYAWMQAVGIVNDHLVTCDFR
ncbi:DNA-3-methyladenine glycosylase I [Hoeflea alexandrii]